MSNLIATIQIKHHIYDDVFLDEDQRKDYENASDEAKIQFIEDFYYDNLGFNNELIIDLY